MHHSNSKKINARVTTCAVVCTVQITENACVNCTIHLIYTHKVMRDAHREKDTLVQYLSDHLRMEKHEIRRCRMC